MGCERTDDNYPHLVTAKVKPAEFADVSCGGATTASLSSTQKTSNGSNPPQLDAVNGKTTLVTLGIGGNDVGFLGIAPSCATAHPSASPCKDKLTAGGHDQIAERIASTAPKVGAVLDKIHAKAPQAKVIVVGYPTVLPDGDGCWPVLPFGSGDVAYFRDGLADLNSMLEDQAKSHRAGFADTATPGKGHDVCADSDKRWVEGLLAGVARRADAPQRARRAGHGRRRGDLAEAALAVRRARGPAACPARSCRRTSPRGRCGRCRRPAARRPCR